MLCCGVKDAQVSVTNGALDTFERRRICPLVTVAAVLPSDRFCLRSRFVGWKLESERRGCMQGVRFRIDFNSRCSIGPGKIELLEDIARHGSIRQAALDLGMSYRHAWLLIDD